MPYRPAPGKYHPMRTVVLPVLALGIVVALGSCAAPIRVADRQDPTGTTRTTTRAPAPVPPATPSGTVTSTAPPAAAAPAPVPVGYRIERRSSDPATVGFVATVRATLADPRGWQQAGFAIVEDPAAPHTVVLAEPAEAQRLCLPLDVYSTYSCQNGPVVVLNADRWRTATPEWTGDLATYRQMLVNHEFGHLLGRRHVPCGTAGTAAPVMCQQSTELDGALPNPWPLPEEVAAAALHDRPIAPAPGQ